MAKLQKKLTIELHKLSTETRSGDVYNEYGIRLEVNGKFAGAADLADISDASRVINNLLDKFENNEIKIK